MLSNDLTDVASHFEFGKNWASYAKLIGDPQVEDARNGLLKLLPIESWRNSSFLDIGCGSGLHSLAAASLGVNRILASDIDPDSVATTERLLNRYNVVIPWQAKKISVFELDPKQHGTFDIVYSWGVLHHTGAMQLAIQKAAALVAPGGHFVIALYRRTKLDWFWVREKRWYTSASSRQQAAARSIYSGYFRLLTLLQGRSFQEYRDTYRERGMDFQHDVHDWLGGYPYESILASELTPQMEALGFKTVLQFAGPITRGLLGSGCDEYVFRRVA